MPPTDPANNAAFTPSSTAIYEFGRDALGPVVADYLTRLLAHARFVEREYGSKILFVSRAGVRILHALRVFAEAANLAIPAGADYFWTSRFMTAKAIWKRDRATAIDFIARESAWLRMDELAVALTRYSEHPVKIPAGSAWADSKGSSLRAFLDGDDLAARTIESVMTEQSDLFYEYLVGLTSGKDHILLVDTGWQGTAQALLAKAFPEWDWWGAYFGCFGEGLAANPQAAKMVPLMVSGEVFNPERPETATILHRHLIEILFEPRGNAIEHFARTSSGIVEPLGKADILADLPDPHNAPLFAGVLEYLRVLPDGACPAGLHRAATRGWKQVARLSLFPRRDEAKWFEGVTRSVDFGQDRSASLIFAPVNRFDHDGPRERIREAIWQFGQIALEYSPETAAIMQRKLGGFSNNAHAMGQRPTVWQRKSDAGKCPAVVVITRTLDRPMLLTRALESVSEQSFEDYVHIIVNDGGDNDLVRTTIEAAPCDLGKILLVDTVCNRGMEAASNIGIAAVDSDYIVIHDDDDSWDPQFLAKTVAFLESPRGRNYGGVITKSHYVSEEIADLGIVIHGRVPYHGWIESVHFMEMAINNFFPPISFLFRREVFDKIDGYNDNYLVLGDWDFNLRFLAESNIAVIPDYLANYHHRDRGDTSVFGNSVVAQRDKHAEFAPIVRNDLIRYFTRCGQPSFAAMVAQGLHWDDMRRQLRSTHVAPTSPLLAQSMVRVALSTEEADKHWVALQRLLLAVERNDWRLLAELRVKNKSPNWASLGNLLPFETSKARPQRTGSSIADRIKILLGHDRGAYRQLQAPPYFNEQGYLARHRDVADVVATDAMASGFEHYYYYGRKEGREVS